MRGDIELAGFVITQDEWKGMDARQRTQLLRAATRRDEPWMPTAPIAATAPVARRAPAVDGDERGRDDYDAYELTLAPA